jgi:hypothetical protein
MHKQKARALAHEPSEYVSALVYFVLNILDVCSDKSIRPPSPRAFRNPMIRHKRENVATVPVKRSPI